MMLDSALGSCGLSWSEPSDPIQWWMGFNIGHEMLHTLGAPCFLGFNSPNQDPGDGSHIIAGLDDVMPTSEIVEQFTLDTLGPTTGTMTTHLVWTSQTPCLLTPCRWCQLLHRN